MTNESAPSLIIFDFDGVLVESNVIKDEAFHFLFQPFGMDVADGAHAYHRRNPGQSRFEKFAGIYQECLGKGITDDEQQKLGQGFADYCYDRIVSCPEVAGAEAFLDSWHGRAKLGIASATPEEELALIVAARGWTDYFTWIFGKPTSKDANLRRLLGLAGCGPSELVFVGDQISDWKAAAAVGTHFVGRVSAEGDPFGADAGFPKIDDLTGLESALGSIFPRLVNDESSPVASSSGGRA